MKCCFHSQTKDNKQGEKRESRSLERQERHDRHDRHSDKLDNVDNPSQELPIHIMERAHILNCLPLSITVADIDSLHVQFQNKASLQKYGSMTTLKLAYMIDQTDIPEMLFTVRSGKMFYQCNVDDRCSPKHRRSLDLKEWATMSRPMTSSGHTQDFSPHNHVFINSIPSKYGNGATFLIVLDMFFDKMY
jgi:hypothetical protein